MSTRAGGPASGPAGTPMLVVVARSAEVLAEPAADERTLADWERRRLALVRIPSRRDDVLAARLLLRWCAAHVTGRPAAELEVRQHCPDCDRTGHGRPFLRGHSRLGVSTSHAEGLVAVAVGRGPVGVDVEPCDRVPPDPDLVRRRFPAFSSGQLPPGSDALTRWVRAEAGFKAGDAALPVHSWSDASRGARAAVACAGAWRLAEAADVAPRTGPFYGLAAFEPLGRGHEWRDDRPQDRGNGD
ncbi:4'-phosphopantetheinyl transferase family protein [Streptomyces sp. NPDC057694]|uniref:4'-phosphopantetheinyl transferase family protein n=1 Tax=Streptomyces sp. NPDC057694 TaxID=3346216 RepID=UPI0036896BB3